MDTEKDTEIELKFLVSENAADILPQLLQQFAEQHQSRCVEDGKVHLSNTYYDTPDKQLRSQDIGFRVRCFDNNIEQTVKTKGKVVGGLHQRPEYNVRSNTQNPDLGLFDGDIWPPGTNVEALQSQLQALFTTDFQRTKWQMLGFEQGFELVFDQGEIRSGDSKTDICEIELELLQGNGDLMFEFAAILAEQMAAHDAALEGKSSGFRLGFQSKAARGYQLYNDTSLEEIKELGAVKLGQMDSLEQAFIKTVEYGLGYMQHHEQCFVDNPNLSALRRFTDGAALIRHAMDLFSEVVVPAEVEHFRAEFKWILTSFGWVEHAKQLQVLKSQRGKFRKKLDKNEALARLVDEEADKDPALEDIKLFFSQPRYIHLMLNLSQWLLNKTWRNSAQFEFKEHPPGTLHQVAGELLTKAWQSLLRAMPKKQSLTVDDYMFHHKQLKRSLLTGTSLGGLYMYQLREDFRLPWIDLSRGIDELKTLDLLKTLAMKLDCEQGGKTLDWLEGQIETLLMAMEQSRLSATKMKTYWSVG